MEYTDTTDEDKSVVSVLKQEPSRWQKLLRHPVFPLLCFVLLAQIIRDNYPFSHYPMYANPSDKPLPFQFLTDAKGNPLPVVWHTGITPSRVVKKFGTRRLELYEAEEKLARREKREPKPEDYFKEQAGRETLEFLRKQSHGRPQRKHLPEDILLMETIISYENGHIQEVTDVVGRLR